MIFHGAEDLRPRGVMMMSSYEKVFFFSFLPPSYFVVWVLCGSLAPEKSFRLYAGTPSFLISAAHLFLHHSAVSLRYWSGADQGLDSNAAASVVGRGCWVLWLWESLLMRRGCGVVRKVVAGDGLGGRKSGLGRWTVNEVSGGWGI